MDFLHVSVVTNIDYCQTEYYGTHLISMNSSERFSTTYEYCGKVGRS